MAFKIINLRTLKMLQKVRRRFNYSTTRLLMIEIEGIYQTQPVYMAQSEAQRGMMQA